MKLTIGDMKELLSAIPDTSNWGPGDSEDIEIQDEKISLKSTSPTNEHYTHKTAHVYWDCPPISLYLVKGYLTGWKWKEFDHDAMEVVN